MAKKKRDWRAQRDRDRARAEAEGIDYDAKTAAWRNASLKRRALREWTPTVEARSIELLNQKYQRHINCNLYFGNGKKSIHDTELYEMFRYLEKCKTKVINLKSDLKRDCIPYYKYDELCEKISGMQIEVMLRDGLKHG